MFARYVLTPVLPVFSLFWVASIVFATELDPTVIEIPFTHTVIDPDPPWQSHCKGVGDIDGDGFPDALIAGAREGDGFFWYRYPEWTRYTIVPPGVSGFTTDMQMADVDGDGDLDAIIPQGYDKGEHVFWYENPRPLGDPTVDPWIDHEIGEAGSHDVEVADLNNDGLLDVVVRGKQTTVFFQNTPTSWTMKVVSNRPDEGVGLGDIDGDGDTDIAINGYWLDNPLPFGDPLIDPWTEFVIDLQVPSRVGVLVADLNDDGRADVVIGPSESTDGQLSWYEGPAEPRSDTWLRHSIDDTVEYLHTFKAADMDLDGDLDLVTAEMSQSNDPDEVSVYRNEGDALSWHQQVVATTGSHNLRIADMDSDGDTDIIGANWQGETPFELWRNDLDPTLSMDAWERHVIDAERPWRAVFISSGDMDDDGLPDIITGGWWYRNPGDFDSNWTRETIGAPLNNMATVYDFDGDGHLDILGTQGIGSAENSAMAWAQNDGVGQFTVRNNIESGDGDFLQGVAVGRFQHGGDLEVALSWHATASGLQRLTVPQDPFQETWRWGQLFPLSLDEEVSTGDMDGDGDLDILLGMQWLRNEATSWAPMTLSLTAAGADRHRLADVNGDGRLDAIIGFEATPKLAWYEQGELAEDPWVEHVISTDFRAPMSLDAGDLDYDGDVDIVAGEHLLSDPTSARLAVFENIDAGATWVSHEVYTGDEHHDGAQLVDIDNDGDLDIVSIGWGHDDVLLYENQSTIVLQSGEQYPLQNGRAVFSFPMDPRQPTPGRGHVSVADTDNDGEMEYIVMTKTGIEDQPGTAGIGAYDHDGSTMWYNHDIDIHTMTNAENFGLPGHTAPGYSKGDVDGDGQIEIVYIKEDRKTLAIIDARNGFQEKTISLNPSTSESGFGLCQVVNLRGAGDQDIICQGWDIDHFRYLAAFRLDTGARLWSRSDYMGVKHGGFRAADIDNDGKDEVTGSIIIDNDGSRMNSWDYPITIDMKHWPHFDSLYIYDVQPDVPGMEIILLEETRSGASNYTAVVNADKIVWRQWHNGWEPQNAAIGDFDPSRPGLEIWCRSRYDNDQQPWVHDAYGNVIATWVMNEKKPSNWSTKGIEVIYSIDWTGGQKQYIAAKERHTAGKVAVIDPMTGQFLKVWENQAKRLYVADVAGDYREELVVLNAVENKIYVYWNPAINSNSKPSYWNYNYYKRQKDNYNYYSP